MSESNYEKHHSVALQTLNDLSDIVLIMKIALLVTVAGLVKRATCQQFV